MILVALQQAADRRVAGVALEGEDLLRGPRVAAERLGARGLALALARGLVRLVSARKPGFRS